MMYSGTIDHRAAMAPALDPLRPRSAGRLMGEYFAALVEARARPLRRTQCAQLNVVVIEYLDKMAPVLRDIGFDQRGQETYRHAVTMTFGDVVECYRR